MRLTSRIPGPWRWRGSTASCLAVLGTLALGCGPRLDTEAGDAAAGDASADDEDDAGAVDEAGDHGESDDGGVGNVDLPPAAPPMVSRATASTAVPPATAA